MQGTKTPQGGHAPGNSETANGANCIRATFILAMSLTGAECGWDDEFIADQLLRYTARTKILYVGSTGRAVCLGHTP